MTETTVTRINGAPGTGKTYTLRQRLERQKAAGLVPEDVNWITFTRSGTEDAVETVSDVFPGLDGDDLEMEPTDVARTFHSLTLAELLRQDHLAFENDDGEPMDPAPIIVQGTFDEQETDPFAEFCQEHGLSYDPDAQETRTLLAGEATETPAGNKFFAINDFLSQTCKPPAKHWDAPIETPTPPGRLETLLEDWDEWKRSRYPNRVYEFADYIDLAFEQAVVPDVDLLLIDEFQDFTPCEYRLYKLWRDSGHIENIVIAGDPEQSIYSFRGGAPLYFEETDRDDDIDLKESYRCPEQVAEAAVRILQAHPQTAPRGFSGRGDGRLRSQTIRDDTELVDTVLDSAERVDGEDDRPRVMLLARTNDQIRSISGALRNNGIPFDILGSRQSLWEYGNLERMLDFLAEYPAATGYSYKSAVAVLEHLPDGESRGSRLSATLGDTVAADQIDDVFAGLPSSVDIIQQLTLSDWKRDALKAAVAAPADLTPQDVQIGTIHTAKGLEASSVMLFAEATGRIVERYERDDQAAAEEHRVWYVGTTRAAEELTICEGYFDGPTAPPMEYLRLSGVVA